jgi:undecaprenyl-diphosphatase
MRTALTTLITFDTNLFMQCNRLQKKAAMASASRLVSRSGDGPLYLFIGFLACYLSPEKGLLFLATGLLAFLIELPIYVCVKNIVRRLRPCDALSAASSVIVPSDRFSLPSGHTAAAALMAVLVADTFPLLGPLAYGWACLIGLSRVFLGVHYPSDILAGALLGISAALCALSLNPMLI